MSKVFLVDSAKVPLDPIHPGRARLLLKAGQAAVYKRCPFTLILKQEVEQATSEPLRLKIDPGAKTTGLALVDDATGEVVWAAELAHRAEAIKKALDKRRGIRRGRRHRRLALVDEHGFPRGFRQRKKRYFGYQTGDLVRAVVPRGARQGTHVGRVAVKASGYFTIQTKTGRVPDVSHRYCQVQHRTDGYHYHFGVRLPLPSTSPKGAPVSSSAF